MIKPKHSTEPGTGHKWHELTIAQPACAAMKCSGFEPMKLTARPRSGSKRMKGQSSGFDQAVRAFRALPRGAIVQLRMASGSDISIVRQ